MQCTAAHMLHAVHTAPLGTSVACTRDSIPHHCSQTMAVAGFPTLNNLLTPPGGASVLEASQSSEERHHHQREAKVVRALATIYAPAQLPLPPSPPPDSKAIQSNPRPGAFSLMMPVLKSFAPAIFAYGGDSQLLPGEEEIVGTPHVSLFCLVLCYC